MAQGRLWLIIEQLEERLALSADALIHLTDAHDQFAYDGSGYTVAILDTGIDYRNSALGSTFGEESSRVVDGYDFVDGRTGDYVEGDSTPGPDGDPMDYAGHGTNIAGIIGSSDPDHIGVAPGVHFVSLRVLDQNNNGSWDWVAEALDWVKQHQQQYNIVAVNMSLGSGNYATTPSMFDVTGRINQLTQSGVSIVSAAGNNFFTYDSAQGMQYPAIIPNVISVGAVYDADVGMQTHESGAVDTTTGPDRVAAFSQRSSSLDLLAPGVAIENTYLSPDGDAAFAAYTGTSQAAAYVTGAIVLMHQALNQAGNSELANPADILSMLQSTGVQVYDGDDEVDNVVNSNRSYARIDLLAALTEASTPSTPLPPDSGSPDDPPTQNWRSDGWTQLGGAPATSFLYAFLQQTAGSQWKLQSASDVPNLPTGDQSALDSFARSADASIPPWATWYLFNASGPGSSSALAAGVPMTASGLQLTTWPPPSNARANQDNVPETSPSLSLASTSDSNTRAPFSSGSPARSSPRVASASAHASAVLSSPL